MHPPFSPTHSMVVEAYRTKKKKPAGMTPLALSQHLRSGDELST
jgi:hypothetical protein